VKLLLGAVLLLATAATVCFAVRVPCPHCLGEGLVQEPPAAAWKTRWIRERDLTPVECPSCSDLHRISLFRKWRRGSQGSPYAPVYRARNMVAFTAQRQVRAASLMDEATRELNGTASRSDILTLLAGALDDEDGKVRAYAIQGIIELRDEKATSVLLRALDHQDHVVQRLACKGLGWLPIREGILPALKRAGGSADPDVQLAATWALFELGALPSPEPLLTALKEKRIRWSEAKKVIVHFQRKEYTFAIIQEMARTPPDRQAEFGQDLERLTGEHFGADPVKWYRWFEKVRDSYPPQIE